MGQLPAQLIERQNIEYDSLQLIYYLYDNSYNPYIITNMKQTSPDDLLYQNQIIQLQFSINDSEGSQKYPSLSPNLQQSMFRQQGEMYKVVKKSSFTLQDSMGNQNNQYNQTNQLSQSFSALNGSIREQNVFKSKLREPTKQKDFWDLHKSIFTDRPDAGLTFNRKSEEQEKYEFKQQYHEQKPFEMQPVHPQPVIQKPIRKQISTQSDIKVILRSTNYFLQKSNGDSLMVNGEMLRDLYDQFFKKQLFIPLFKYQKFDQWYNSKDKFNIDLEAHRIFKMSLQRYVKYLNSRYPNQFRLVFKILQQIQRGKVAKKRQQTSFGFLNFDFTSIMQNLKNYISSSKTQILRKNKLAKIRSIRQNTKIAQLYGLIKQMQIMSKKIEEQWDQFGEIQLLLNFEQTEYYCTKKIENSPQLKFRQIWIKYRDFIRIQKMQHSQRNNAIGILI